MTPEKMGEELARQCRWDIEKISAAIIAALTEANFHSCAKSFSELIEFEKGRAQ